MNGLLSLGIAMLLAGSAGDQPQRAAIRRKGFSAESIFTA